MKKIKVLFRLRSLEIGGVPRMILDLLNNLPKDQFELALMVNLFQGELISEIPEGIKVIIVEKGREQMSSIKIIRKWQLIIRRLKLEFYRIFPSILYAIKVKEKYDIEVASGYAEFEMVLSSPNKQSRKIGWFHSDVSYDNNLERVMHRINQMKQFDWMVFCSKQTRQIIDDLYQIKYYNSSIIYNAIKLDEIRQKANQFPVDFSLRPTFVSVGRLHHRKGYAELMNVHKRLLDNNFIHSVVVIGNGNEMENLKKQAIELGVQNSFILLGAQNNPFPYIKAADFFILPSKSEAYPLTIGEALALYKPIISTNVGGIAEMIDHDKDGILINFDENEMYDAMKNFLTQPDLVEKIVNGTKNIDLKFSTERIYNQVTDVFIQQYSLKNGK